jgi:hypothetical protein
MPGSAPMSNEQKKEYIAALLREREGYEKYGRTDELAAVDAELKRLGHGGKPPAKRATKMDKKDKTEL